MAAAIKDRYMEVELFLHGTPKGYNFIGKSDEFSYCSTFYTNQNENEKIVVELRNIGNTTYCYYTYIKSQNINSADSRPGGYIALTVRLDSYCRDIIAFYFILKAIYKKHIVGIFVQEVGDTTKYIVESLSSKEGELDNMMRTLVQLLSLQIPSAEFSKIRYETIPNQRGSIQLSLFDCTNESLLNAIKKFGKVSVSMSYPSARERNLRVKMEADLEHRTNMLKSQLHHLSSEHEGLLRKFEYADKVKHGLLCQNDELKARIADFEARVKKLSNEADLRSEIVKISDPLLRLNGMLQRYGISLTSQQRPIPVQLQLERAIDNKMPSKKYANLSVLFSFIAVVLLLVVMAFQLVLVFRDNSLPVDNKVIETIPEQNLNVGKETLLEPAVVTDLSNMIINIREYHGKGPLQYGRVYSLYISNKGNLNQPDSIKGLRWECDGGEIYPIGGNEARLRLKKKNGPVKIVCLFPNGESIVRVVEVSSNDEEKKQNSEPILKMEKNERGNPTSKKQSQANYRIKG